QVAALAPGWIEKLDAIAADAQSKGQRDVVSLSNALKEALQKNDRKAIEAAAAKMSKLGSRTLPGALAGEIRAHAAADASTRVFTSDNVARAVYVGVFVLILAAAGIALLGARVLPFVIGVPAILGLAWLARLLAGNGLFVDYGVEYVIFALGIGLLISNTVGVPRWLKPAVQTEFFIKTGLVILGAGLLFTDIVQAGVLGSVRA